MKDKEISEEELLDELDTMYQRVADIEKEEAATEAPPPLMIKPIKPKQKKKRSYRTLIIMTSVFFIILASIFTITIFDPMNFLRRLKMGDSLPPRVATQQAPSKRSTVVPSPVPPKPSSATTSPAAPASPSVTPSSAPPKPASELPPIQTKQEAVKNTQEEAEKAKPQEILKPNKPAPPGKYYSIQVGSFRDMENVRELTEAFKKEGLDAYWITMKSRSRGTLYRVLVGQFTDENEATQFLNNRKIFRNYPDSFIKEVSSSKINP